jgi:lipoate-protein ligase B
MLRKIWKGKTKSENASLYRFEGPLNFKLLGSIESMQHAFGRPCVVHNIPGLTPYVSAWRWQRILAQRSMDAQKQGKHEHPDTLLVVEHPSVYTLGRGSTLSNLKFDPRDPSCPHTIHRVERGGEVTWHGPGQIVCYPIFDLSYHRKDLHWSVQVVVINWEWRSVCDLKFRTKFSDHVSLGIGTRSRVLWSIRSQHWAFTLCVTPLALACGWVVLKLLQWVSVFPGYALQSCSDLLLLVIFFLLKFTHLCRWITMHGLALNVNPDLDAFSHIIPCGIGNRAVTSVELELRKLNSGSLPRSCSVLEIRKQLISSLSSAFSLDVTEVQTPPSFLLHNEESNLSDADWLSKHQRPLWVLLNPGFTHLPGQHQDLTL